MNSSCRKIKGITTVFLSPVTQIQGIFIFIFQQCSRTALLQYVRKTPRVTRELPPPTLDGPLGPPQPVRNDASASTVKSTAHQDSPSAQGFQNSYQQFLSGQQHHSPGAVSSGSKISKDESHSRLVPLSRDSGLGGESVQNTKGAKRHQKRTSSSESPSSVGNLQVIREKTMSLVRKRRHSDSGITSDESARCSERDNNVEQNKTQEQSEVLQENNRREQIDSHDNIFEKMTALNHTVSSEDKKPGRRRGRPPKKSRKGGRKKVVNTENTLKLATESGSIKCTERLGYSPCMNGTDIARKTSKSSDDIEMVPERVRLPSVSDHGENSFCRYTEPSPDSGIQSPGSPNGNESPNSVISSDNTTLGLPAQGHPTLESSGLGTLGTHRIREPGENDNYRSGKNAGKHSSTTDSSDSEVNLNKITHVVGAGDNAPFRYSEQQFDSLVVNTNESVSTGSLSDTSSSHSPSPGKKKSVGRVPKRAEFLRAHKSSMLLNTGKMPSQSPNNSEIKEGETTEFPLPALPVPSLEERLAVFSNDSHVSKPGTKKQKLSHVVSYSQMKDSYKKQTAIKISKDPLSVYDFDDHDKPKEKRKRGRPKGSKNKVKVADNILGAVNKVKKLVSPKIKIKKTAGQTAARLLLTKAGFKTGGLQHFTADGVKIKRRGRPPGKLSRQRMSKGGKLDKNASSLINGTEKRRPGRPKGSKNKKTLLAMMEKSANNVASAGDNTTDFSSMQQVDYTTFLNSQHEHKQAQSREDVDTSSMLLPSSSMSRTGQTDTENIPKSPQPPNIIVPSHESDYLQNLSDISPAKSSCSESNTVVPEEPQQLSIEEVTEEPCSASMLPRTVAPQGTHKKRGPGRPKKNPAPETSKTNKETQHQTIHDRERSDLGSLIHKVQQSIFSHQSVPNVLEQIDHNHTSEPSTLFGHIHPSYPSPNFNPFKEAHKIIPKIRKPKLHVMMRKHGNKKKRKKRISDNSSNAGSTFTSKFKLHSAKAALGFLDKGSTLRTSQSSVDSNDEEDVCSSSSISNKELQERISQQKLKKRKKEKKLLYFKSKHRNIVDPVFMSDLQYVVNNFHLLAISEETFIRVKPGEVPLPSIFKLNIINVKSKKKDSKMHFEFERAKKFKAKRDYHHVDKIVAKGKLGNLKTFRQKSFSFPEDCLLTPVDTRADSVGSQQCLPPKKRHKLFSVSPQGSTSSSDYISATDESDVQRTPEKQEKRKVGRPKKIPQKQPLRVCDSTPGKFYFKDTPSTVHIVAAFWQFFSMRGKKSCNSCTF